MFLELTQNERCFNVEFYQWINVEKSKLNQHGRRSTCWINMDAAWRRDVISTYITVESTLSVCWDFLSKCITAPGYGTSSKLLWKITHKQQKVRDQSCNFIKILTLAQVFPCEFCGISKQLRWLLLYNIFLFSHFLNRWTINFY